MIYTHLWHVVKQVSKSRRQWWLMIHGIETCYVRFFATGWAHRRRNSLRDY